MSVKLVRKLFLSSIAVVCLLGMAASFVVLLNFHSRLYKIQDKSRSPGPSSITIADHELQLDDPDLIPKLEDLYQNCALTESERDYVFYRLFLGLWGTTRINQFICDAVREHPNEYVFDGALALSDNQLEMMSDSEQRCIIAVYLDILADNKLTYARRAKALDRFFGMHLSILSPTERSRLGSALREFVNESHWQYVKLKADYINNELLKLSTQP